MCERSRGWEDGCCDFVGNGGRDWGFLVSYEGLRVEASGGSECLDAWMGE